MSAPDRRAMLETGHGKLSVRRQCALLGVTRSLIYRLSQPANDEDGKLRRRLDELYTAHSFYGSRRMTLVLREDGRIVNRKRVRRLMRLMGIEALVSCTRFFWTPICPRRDWNDDVQHEADRRSFLR